MFEKFFKYPLELFRQGELGFSTPMAAELRLLLVLLAAGAVYWLYRHSRQTVSPLRRRVLVVLRAAALAVLIAMLLKPVLRLPKLKSDETFMALMLDTSKSMTIEDAAAGGSRFDAARKLLFGEGGARGLADDVSSSFAVRVFGLADGAQRMRDPQALKAEGEHTNYFRALREVDQEMRGVSLAAVVLVSDGGNNGAGSPAEMAEHFKAQGIKLFTVGYGSANPPKDYEIVRVAVPRKVRRNAQVEAFATVRCTGYKDPFTVFLRQGDAILSTMEVKPQEGKDMYQVRFTFYPEKEGAQKYNLFIKPGAGEKVTDNNLSEFLVDVIENRLPVLYVEGSPRTEFRFIRRALFRDPDFRIVSLLRTGHGRYYVQGADDMPELQKGYPATKELLYKFEGIIFGDIEAGFFTAEQLQMTEDFVKERGGGFAMLGGVNSFNLGNYKGTAVENMLPVVLQDSKNAYSFDRFKMQVPEDALRHPILHQDDDLDANKRAWDRVPDLDGSNQIKGVKTAAQVLALNPKTNLPVLAVQKYGRGRVAAFCTGGSWAWRMSVNTDV
ncbi:MAG: VWA domain-containing protein [Planctomycetes bacterium]|nr:VWA domain-containing protein [Planctomycetota bacterium]